MDPHQRLNRALNERRLELGMKWGQVAQAAGITPRSLLDIRRGAHKPRELTARALDTYLGAPAGTVRRIMDAEGPPLVAAEEPLIAEITESARLLMPRQRRLVLELIREIGPG